MRVVRVRIFKSNKEISSGESVLTDRKGKVSIYACGQQDKRDEELEGQGNNHAEDEEH